MVPDDDNAKDYTEFFSRHIVGLSWYEGLINKRGEFRERPQYQCASGFLMQIGSSYCLVTAGHVLTDYNSRIKSGVVGRSHSLIDRWSPRSEVDHPIPFDFTDEFLSIVVDDRDLGLDFAAIALPGLVLEALLQTIKPFTYEQCTNCNKSVFDLYGMLGAPAEAAVQTDFNEGEGNVVITWPDSRVIRIKECLNPPDNIQKN